MCSRALAQKPPVREAACRFTEGSFTAQLAAQKRVTWALDLLPAGRPCDLAGPQSWAALSQGLLGVSVPHKSGRWRHSASRSARWASAEWLHLHTYATVWWMRAYCPGTGEVTITRGAQEGGECQRKCRWGYDFHLPYQYVNTLINILYICWTSLFFSKCAENLKTYSCSQCGFLT